MEKNSSSCIIILNWNGKEDTLNCLQSLKKITSPHYETIVVDNGSHDGSAAAIREKYPHITLLETGKNLGYAGGNNVGIEYGLKKDHEFFFILNNDTTVDSHVIEHFLKGFENDPQAGILGAKIYLMDEPEKLDHLGGIWNSKKMNFDLVGFGEMDRKEWNQPVELDYVCGAGLMIHRKVLEKIGLPNPDFFLYWEETDYCACAKRHGFKILSCPQAKIWHKSGASMPSKAFQRYFFHRNRLLWIERNTHGLKKAFYLIRLLGFYLPGCYKLLFLKKIQLFLEKIFNPSKDQTRKKKLLKNTTAIIKGMQDYLARNFNEGSSMQFLGKNK